MRYPREVVDEVRLQNDIVEVISQYVPLKQKGSSYFGLCPFHNEKTASFSVNSEKQFYYCFGCGAAGNVFSFLMEMENCDFPEAMKRLAERAHITLPEPEKNAQAIAAEQLKKRLFEMHTLAGRFFYEALQEEEGAEARAYLQKRQMDPRMARKFGIGYSPDSYDALFRHLQEKGFKVSEILKTGLVLENKDGKGYHDRFRGRLMFPIFDVQGRVVGFGGRILAKGEPKYLNSPETLLFSKSRNLYGLNFAKQTRKRELILVEGYMDMLSIYQSGFHNVVASLGTAFNQEHARTLKRFADDVILLYDSDEAGTNAALRAIPVLVKNGFHVKVTQVPDGKDPDEFIKGLGAQALEERIRKAMSSFMFQVKVAAGRYDQDDPESKTQFQHEAAKLLATIEEPLERKNYIEAVSREYYIGAKDLEDLVNYYGTSGYSSAQRQQTTPRQQERRLQVNEAKEEKKKQPQKLLLTWMVNEPQLFDKLEGIIGPDDFYEQIYHGVALLLFKQYEEEKAVIPGKILNQYTDLEDQKKIAELFNTTLKISPLAEDRDKALNDIVRRVKEDSIEQQMNATNDILRWQDLIKEKANLAKLHISL